MDHTCELIIQARAGDKDALDRLARENAGLVWSVVRRFGSRGYDVEDLFQIGNIGLMKCIEHFDFSREVKFSTYAVPLIMGEIRRFLRDDGIIKVSRSLKDIACKVYKEKEKYQTDHQRDPTLEEISQALNLDEADILLAMESGQEVRSLHQVIYQGDGDEICLEDRIESSRDEIGESERKIYLHQLLSTLTRKEYDLISLRYFHNETQVNTAKKMGLSQVQVSRLEKKILARLREVDIS